MKNFFQRRQDIRPSSTAPANDTYKVWLPPPDLSRPPPPGPNQWTHASSARPRGETQHRSSSRAQADASSVPPSSTYKYATVPPNSTGFYYPNPGPAQSFPPQYYPPGGFAPDRPDSRLGYVPYPYPTPQYPQSFVAAPAASQPATTSRRDDKKRNAGDGRGSNAGPPPSARPSSSRKHSETDDRARRSSSSSLRGQKREEEAEMKKPKHRTKEPSETRKRRDSQVGDSYAEKYRDQSSRKESKRDSSKFRQNPRVEEGDSSDSAQRPSSVAGHRRRQLREGMMNRPQQEPIPFPGSSRTGVPLQPTAASSSSGKHTPQNSRMPVYLPASHERTNRRDEGQPGLSESDTDYGTFNRGRNFLRAKQFKPSEPTTVEKKVKEAGLWPFSRSKSSQKLPQNPPPSVADILSKKTRADSTPARIPSPRESQSRPDVFETQPASSRALFFATQPSELSSRPIASQQAALHSLRSRNEAAPLSGQRPIEHPPPAAMLSGHRQNPTLLTSALQMPGVSVGPSQIERPETPLRRDGRDPSSLPPLYAPAPARTSDYPRNSERSTTPKVSQLVAGFEARSSDTQPHIPQQVVKPIAATREVVEKPSLQQMYLPHQQSGQSTGAASMSTRRPPAPADSHIMPSQPPATPQPRRKREERSHGHSRPVESNVQRPAINEPHVLKTQLRDLLTDNSSTLRNDENPPPQVAALPPESRLHQASAPPMFNPMAKPPEWNPSSQLYAYSQPPVQVYTAGTSSTPFKSVEKSEKPNEIPLVSNPVPTGSSRRPDVSQTDTVDHASRGGASRLDDPGDVNRGPRQSSSENRVELPPVSNPILASSSRRPDISLSDPMDRAARGGARLGDDLRDVDRGQKQSSRSKKEPIAVMKTPSKESSRHTSSSSPVILSHPAPSSRSQDKVKGTSLQPPPTSRSHSHTVQPEAQNTGRSEPSSSSLLGDRASQRDHRSTSITPQFSSQLHSYDPPITSTTASGPSVRQSESSRGIPPASTRIYPNNPPSPVSSYLPSTRTSGRSTVPASNEMPAVIPQWSSRSSVVPPSTVPRAPSEESLLKTPSSLAPSMLHPSASRTSIPASVASETRKKGIFGGMFRSKAAQQTSAFDVRHPSQPTDIDHRPQSTLETVDQPERQRKVPSPITVPSPALPISDRKSPNSRGFMPFRYLTTKRNRRVSTASMDAEDGTAPNTVMGSPTASMQSSQMPPHSPPRRDPRVATQDWRNQEESDVKARGKPRRMRPGVVFDVAEDPLEETKKRSRPTRIKKSKPQIQAADPPITDSSDA